MTSNCKACKPCMPCLTCVAHTVEVLTHGTDGPITDFVLISRAMKLAASQRVSPEIVANALNDALVSYGWLDDTSPIHVTGS